MKPEKKTNGIDTAKTVIGVIGTVGVDIILGKVIGSFCPPVKGIAKLCTVTGTILIAWATSKKIKEASDDLVDTVVDVYTASAEIAQKSKDEPQPNKLTA